MSAIATGSYSIGAAGGGDVVESPTVPACSGDAQKGQHVIAAPAVGEVGAPPTVALSAAAEVAAAAAECSTVAAAGGWPRARDADTRCLGSSAITTRKAGCSELKPSLIMIASFVSTASGSRSKAASSRTNCMMKGTSEASATRKRRQCCETVVTGPDEVAERLPRTPFSSAVAQRRASRRSRGEQPGGGGQENSGAAAIVLRGMGSIAPIIDPRTDG